jgi:hypothetical protein
MRNIPGSRRISRSGVDRLDQVLLVLQSAIKARGRALAEERREHRERGRIRIGVRRRVESEVRPGARRLHRLDAHPELCLRRFDLPQLEVVLATDVRGERLPQLPRHGLRVEIAHGREDHLIRNVALFIERAECAELGVLDRVLQADRVPLVGMVAEHEPLDLEVDLVVGPVLALIELLHHDLPLLRDLRLGQLERHPRVHRAPERLVEIRGRRREAVAGVVVRRVAAGLLAQPLHLAAELELLLPRRAAAEDQVLVVVAQPRQPGALGAAPAVHEDADARERLRVVLDEDEAKAVRRVSW